MQQDIEGRVRAQPRRVRLGVNVDHVATIRQARGTRYPDPVVAASVAELAGADQITVHLREDRRHIQDRDLAVMKETVVVPLNLEMAATAEMLEIALATGPAMVTLVPEKREERTTEGGLDVVRQAELLGLYCAKLRDAGIATSLFVDPEPAQIEASERVGASIVELHTGDYAEAQSAAGREAELDKLRRSAIDAHERGLIVAAGHGLEYHNVRAVAALPWVEELNIGHSIVARALFVGFERAVREMIQRMAELP
jgi:pyridoxine 5-phosphate synthase